MKLDIRLKRLRKERNITQQQLSKHIYVSIQTINKWENGKCLPDVINLLSIARFYQVSLDELMENDFSKKKERSRVLKLLKWLFKFK